MQSNSMFDYCLSQKSLHVLNKDFNIIQIPKSKYIQNYLGIICFEDGIGKYLRVYVQTIQHVQNLCICLSVVCHLKIYSADIRSVDIFRGKEVAQH